MNTECGIKLIITDVFMLSGEEIVSPNQIMLAVRPNDLKCCTFG